MPWAGPRRVSKTPEDHELVEKEKRFVAYCVARWGVYADFWELLNERKASDRVDLFDGRLCALRGSRP